MKKLIFILFLTVIANSAFCKTITVTSSADSGIGTLRQAVIDAASGDVIVFDANVTTITLLDQIDIDKNISIIGNAENTTVIKRNGTGTDKKRHFYMPNNESEVTFSYLTLQDNHVNCDGGAIASAGKLTLNNCVFSNNKANYTSGAVLSYGTLFVYNCTFNNNSSSSVGGAVCCHTANIVKCTFRENYSSGGGGAIYASGSSDTLYTVTIKDCLFEGNSAIASGAIANYGNTVVENCTFRGNKTSNSEAAIRNSAKIVIANSIFDTNECPIEGIVSNRYSSFMGLNPSATIINGLFFNNSLTGYSGTDIQRLGVLKNDIYGTLTVKNSTLANNKAVAFAINNDSGIGTVDKGNIYLYNNIFWNNVTNDGDMYDFYIGGEDTEITAFNNMIGKTNSALLDFSNYINIDPLFVDSNNNYSLQSYSPAIDVGNNSFYSYTDYPKDLANDYRIDNSTIDIGAYEYQSGNPLLSNKHINNDKLKIYTMDKNIVIANTTKPVSVYNLQGICIFSGMKNVFTVKSSGVYIVHVEEKVQKIIVE